jgi:hypothetical protein
MKVGTRSVLFGAHCFFLHPWFVAAAWWRLYGFPWDPRLWVAFAVHDIGYIGKTNMDGEEGETHPELGAAIMFRFFDVENADGPVRGRWFARVVNALFGTGAAITGADHTWCGFTRYHSRYYAKSHGTQPSRLCIADKLAIALDPWWLYLPRVWLSGELAEYMAHARHRIQGNERVSAAEKGRLTSGSARDWYAGVQSYCRRWALEHVDGKADTWTSDARKRATVNAEGVWQ